MYAIQLAKLYGADVTGVDNAEKLEFMRSLGADHVIDYTREDFTRNGRTYDLILDLARNSLGADPAGERQEFVDLVEKSQRLEAAKESDSQNPAPAKFVSPPKAKKRR